MGFNAFDDFMFSFGPIFFFIVFALVIGFFIVVIVKSIGQWSKNNNSPRLTVPAHVVTKRAHTSGGSGDSSASTWYYATFQVESGDRMELSVSAKEYGMLAEGDIGMLAFQGTRYLGFERK
ncbi:DUF2500 domain-containing protein [Sporosarcina thermotolerans]|uniref:DUF2500 domain-containing protein n=1 Tax=Sporosarcina thermotolerans TaxID=633404 RepID=A0AAW9A7B2_9BACL|nr:DUF2500 domain-containing protein [Sporosarcina thermotolerans]MDW0117272.1 DUF2500 domain-containing protein [Sporosarcina thermotolerans]WHT47433.1 DUF2500 domain-containing protein [Sporosarcina thermotolerans]